MARLCKMCKLEFETETGYELHRIAHMIKTIALDLHESTTATLKALKEAQP